MIRSEMFESTTHWLIEPRTVSSENVWFILSQKKMSEMIIAFRENSNNIMEFLKTYNVPHWDVKDHVVALLRHGVKRITESRLNRVSERNCSKEPILTHKSDFP